jgi:hypothetical protein
LAILSRPDLPKVVGVHWVARELERRWEEIRSNIRASTKVAKGLRDLGWKYRRPKSRFMKRAPAETGAVEGVQ